jgi:hypothetical protein
MVGSGLLYIIGHESAKKGIELMSCELDFTQNYDHVMKPNSEVAGGLISLSFEAVSGNEIIQWMISKDSEKKVKIVFSDKQDSKPFQEVKFIGARLVSYSQSFSPGMSLMVTLSLAVRAINVSGVVFRNRWVGYEKEELSEKDWDF